jgi:hypothetical protein
MDKYDVPLGDPRAYEGVNTPTSVAENRYPQVHLTLPEDVEIEESGTITFEFRRTEKVERTTDGKTTCSYGLELVKLVGCECEEEEESKSPSKTTEDALDRLLKEITEARNES